MENKGYLPIGTLCQFDCDQNDYMIIGYCIASKNEMYDYVGVIFPVGLISQESMIAFNRDKISKVTHLGYSDEKSEKYLKNLEAFVSSKKDKNYQNLSSESILKVMEKYAEFVKKGGKNE